MFCCFSLFFFFLRQTPWGLNVLLFAGALVAAFVMLVLRRKQEFWNKQTIALNGALIFFAAMFVWRDSQELKVFDTLAILTILAILTLPVLKIKPQIAGVFHYIIGFIWAGFSASLAPFLLVFNDVKWKTIPQTGWSKHLISVLRGVLIAAPILLIFGAFFSFFFRFSALAPFLLVFHDVEWKTIPQTGWSKHLISVLRGVLIAAPILLIFGALFVAADAVFQGIVEQTFNIRADIVVAHIFFTGFFSWIVAGYLRGSLVENFSEDAKKTFLEIKEIEKPKNLSVTDIKDEDEPKSEEKPKIEEKKKWTWQNFDNSIFPKVFTLGAIEVSIVLGLINLLFLAFVIVQIPYLFGGMDLVQNTPDFKLAEYARRGFGELVTVAALVLPILLISHWLLRKDNPLNEKIFRVLAGMNIVLLFVIMLSATQRLLLLDRKSRLRFNDDSALSDDLYDLAGVDFYLVYADGFARGA